MRSVRRALGWGLFVAVDVAAIVVALRAPPPPPKGALSDTDAHLLYWTLGREEPSMRAASARSFPGDPWSQDDDFHAQEQKKARAFAGERQARLEDALRAVDDGMREGWPSPVAMSPRVPPCRPRLDY